MDPMGNLSQGYNTQLEKNDGLSENGLAFFLVAYLQHGFPILLAIKMAFRGYTHLYPIYTLRTPNTPKSEPTDNKSQRENSPVLGWMLRRLKL